MSEYTVNLTKDNDEKDNTIDALRNQIGEVVALRDTAIDQAKALQEQVSAQTEQISALTSQAKQANERTYALQRELREFKTLTRQTLLELKEAHDISREDINEALAGLELEEIKRKIKGTVRITYTVDVELEDIEVEDGDDEEDTLLQAASDYDTSDVDVYNLSYEDASVEDWEEQDDE